MILTQKSTKILGIIAAVIAFAIGVMLVIVPTYEKVSANNENIKQAESEVALMQSQRDGYLQAQQLYPELNKIDGELRVRFPEIADNDGIIAQLSQALAASGISSNTLNLNFSAPVVLEPTFAAPPEPTEEAEEGESQETPEPTPAPATASTSISDMAKMDVSISVSGTDSQIVEFLNVLHAAERAIVTKQFSVNTNQETGSSDLALTAEVYIFAKIPNPGEQSPEELAAEEVVAAEEAVTAEEFEDTLSE